VKKTILQVTKLAIIATLLCIGCGDDDKDKNPDWNGEADGFLGRISGASFYTLTTEVSPVGGGTVSRSPAKTSYPKGAEVTVTAAAAEHYVFKGWSGASTYTAAKSMAITMDGNMTLTANFEDPRRATVYFDGNGATVGVPEAVNVLKGTVITLPGQGSMARIDYTFVGWNTNRDGRGTNYVADTSYTVTSNITLYAKWATRKRTVTYNGNGATTGVPQSVIVDSGTVITLPGQGGMARTDYTFVGWTTSGTDYTANSFYTVTKNVTLYAKWTTQKRTLTYYGNGATVGVPQSVTVDSGTVITLPGQGSMARTGYNFIGWSRNSDGTGTNYAANSSYTVTGNVSLYAKWVVIHTLADPLSYGGQTYKTVKSGSQTWMAENLNYQPSSGNSWCYDNVESNCNTYGRLYDWSTALIVCPTGWHLPSRREWGGLAIAAGGTGEYGNDGTAGTKLKSTSGWNIYNDVRGSGTDDYGFSALPGGYRYAGGSFNGAGYNGFWWTATGSGSGIAYIRYMNYYDVNVREDSYDMGYGFSVRCVQD
jgi:uncharacterized protein (TIGR02145 family)/uncharacterized repeat protein (TIGR02543 family)